MIDAFARARPAVLTTVALGIAYAAAACTSDRPSVVPAGIRAGAVPVAASVDGAD